MTEYQQADTLFTDTAVAFAGQGSASPVAADGGSDYTAWQWEVVLATVLGIAIPARAEVTGQPWLTIEQNGQGGAGLHLIWTASWDTKPNSGAASLQAYLNPGVYAMGGAWDQFVSTPAGPMSKVASQDYRGLPLDPGTFESASTSLGNVTTMLGSVGQQFADLRSHATSDSAGFRGNLADVVAQLLGDLGSTTQSLHDQMTEPASYSQSVSSAGTAGTAFLVSLESAYNGWLATGEHSPLGAIVQVLKQIATQDSTGAYVISSPQQTPYGDLTTPSAWATVEQRAKDLWTSSLTGDSDFAGLDPLARSALSNLVSQYEATTRALVPVIGPAPPRPKPNPVGKGNGNGNGGGKGNVGPGSKVTGGAGGPEGGPGGGPGDSQVKDFVVSPGPGAGAGANGPGSGGSGPNGGQIVTANVIAVPALPGDPPLPGSAQGRAGSGLVMVTGFMALGHEVGPGSGATGAGSALPGVGQNDSLAAAALPEGIAHGLGTGQIGLSGPIGGQSKRRQPGEAASPTSGGGLPVAIIGALENGGGSRNRKRRRQSQPGGRPLGQPALPEAGLALGRAAASAGLRPLAGMPGAGAAQAPRPGAVNTELVPVAASAPSAGPPAADGQAAQTAVGGANATGLDGEPMMLMPGLAAGRRSRDQERQRLAYLPEDEEYWGTDPRDVVASIGGRDVADPPEQDFEPGPALARIRPDHAVRIHGHTRPDRRKP